ncbi:serine/threonine protein kinase [Nonomuraea thailandensis]|uniref:non-specific serine/threonine protein kinase n=1 Tax=Nonomuraea thailandensis TaxID=1188745 RepID=A0A9X2K4L9_9ACTN|nr:serine/threonine-protein kinase [Nonomuraea thailandensis]MCP2359455.1 serine/threonine protein kinase [Nonomuraea thailandensis]
MSDRKQDGRRIAGRYQLQEPIGRGGMGIVWRAYDELLDRTVAVKEVRYAAALGEEVQLLNRRTMREARAAARFEHPNVIVVHDVIEEDERPWIVMQLVPSRSLGAVIKQDGPLPPKRVAEIGLAVLDALHRAHEAGVLHRDVKPENVLLADDGRVVLTDFGIATLETETQLTVTGLAGTPAFIAPERLKGLPARRESDLWSLGATLYTAVEGRSPHERGMALATMHAVLTDEPDPATHAGPLSDVISGLLVKEPVQRLTYEETQRMLRRALRAMIAAEPDSGSTGPSNPPLTKQFPAAQELQVPAPAEQKRPAAPPARPKRPAKARRPYEPVEDDTPTDPNLLADRASQEAMPETGARITQTPTAEPPRPPAESTMDAARPDPQRKPTIVIAAAIAVLLVAAVGGYLGLNSAPDDETRQHAGARAAAVTTSPSQASPSTPASQPPSPSPTVSSSPSASPSASPTSAPEETKEAEKDPLPSGWKYYTDKKLGFKIGLPKGWDEWVRSGRGVEFKGPGGASNAHVRVEEMPKLGKDPLKGWKKLEPSLKDRYGGYKKIGIEKADYREAAADWDFYWPTNTGKSRIRYRGFVAENGKSYAIYWHTLSSHWKKDYDFFEGFCATFVPPK